jgi:hypothetical protein
MSEVLEEDDDDEEEEEADGREDLWSHGLYAIAISRSLSVCPSLSMLDLA